MFLKKCPLNHEQLEELTKQFPTPFHLYDEAAIRANARALKASFAWNPGFKEYFAVKAAPNPYLMKILKAEWFGADCSSLPELMLAEAVGLSGEEIIFTSNDTPADEYRKAIELGAIINLDDITHIEFLEQCTGLPELACCRYNPGPLKNGNAIIGHPEEAKYGFTRFPCAYTNRFFHRKNKYLAIANAACARRIHYCFQYGFERIIPHHDFQLHFRQKLNHVFSATIKLLVTFLATESFYFRDGKPLNANFGQSFLDFFQLKGLNDCFYFFHGKTSSMTESCS